MKQAQSEKAELRAQIAALKEEQARDSIKMAELEKAKLSGDQQLADMKQKQTVAKQHQSLSQVTQ